MSSYFTTEEDSIKEYNFLYESGSVGYTVGVYVGDDNTLIKDSVIYVTVCNDLTGDASVDTEASPVNKIGA